MSQTATLIAATLMSVSQGDIDAAKADRARYPQADWPQIYYATAGHLEGEPRDDLVRAIRFMAASTSLQPVIERCNLTPLRDRPWLLRIDLRDMGWAYDDWVAVVSANKYGPKHPLIVRADWLLLQLADQNESDAYFRLLFGDKVPKTRDEFLKLLDVSEKVEHRFGLIEAQSGVSIQGTRWLESRPKDRGYAWGTRDVLELTADKDFLEFPDGSVKHDGEEWIIGIPKISTKTGKRGTLQVYALANGDGGLVTRAPVDLVEDTTRFRGLAEIRNPGSCIQCHSRGINEPTKNALRALIKAGVDPYAGKKKTADLERFHLGDVTKEIKRNQEDFADGVMVAAEMAAQDTVAAFKRAIDRYDADVTLAVAAAELHTTPDDLKLALGFASAKEHVGARIASLAHGMKVKRDTWEERFLIVQEYVRDWRKRN